MKLRSMHDARPPFHPFSTLTSHQRVVRVGNTPMLQRQTAAELRAHSALFLVPKGEKPRLRRRWKPRLADGLVLTVALAAMVALWMLL